MSRGLSLHEPGRESRRRPGVQRVGVVRGRERVFRAKVSSVLVEAPSEAGDGDWRERFGESVDEWEFGTAVTDKRRPGESSEVSHVGHDERERLSGVASARNVFSLKQKKICVEQETKEEPCQMGGFTRVLHDKPDSLMSEIPTCVVDRLDNEMGFVVLSRPNAFMQYFEKCDKIEETYVLMAEPDHVYIKPIPNLMIGERPAAFPFFYIEPSRWPTLVKRFVGNDKMSAQDIEKVDPIGSSPVFIRKDDLKRLAPVWVETTLAIKKDKEANRDWGFGQWRFDKRTYQNGIPPRDLLAPPEKSDNELVKLLIACINEASKNIDTWETFDGKNRVVHKGAQNQPNVKKKM